MAVGSTGNNHVVNIKEPSCSCADWQRSKLPCKHIMATAMKQFTWIGVNSNYHNHVFMTQDDSIVNKPRTKESFHPIPSSDEIQGIRAKLKFLYNATFQSLNTPIIASLQSSLTSIAKFIPQNTADKSPFMWKQPEFSHCTSHERPKSPPGDRSAVITNTAKATKVKIQTTIQCQR